MNPDTKEKFRRFASVIDGELLTGKVMRSAYSTDASMYQIIPDAVLVPKSIRDVNRAIDLCAQEKVAFIPRGAGTNMTGSALGAGMICDFSKYLSGIIELNPEEEFCWAEPGLVHGELQSRLGEHGKFFPPDPSSGEYCTLGGIAANNSSGIHALKYGDAKDWITDMNVMLSGGQEISTALLSAREDLHLLRKDNLRDFEDEISYKVYNLIRENISLLKRARPSALKNSSGYNLYEAFKGNALDWNKIFVGSEGTLGVFKSIKLRIRDIPKFKMLFLCSFKSMEDSLLLLEEILKLKPSGCELLDDVLIELVIKENPEIRGFLPSNCRSLLLVEFDAMDADEIEKSTASFRDIVSGMAVKVEEARIKEKQEFLWSIRKAASPILNRVEGKKKPVRFIEDLAVHPSRLLKFIKDLKKLMKQFGFSAAIHGHVGAGNIHVNPNIDTREEGYKDKLRDFASKTYDLVRSYGGSIAGEHGDGILRAPFVNTGQGELTDIYRKLKSILDPAGIMNPGKKITNETSLNVASLRYDGESYDSYPIIDGDLHEELSKCHGCGTCRHYCPVALTTKDESDTARSKVNLLKMVACGDIPQDKETLLEVLDVIDHCVNCGQCTVSCPTVIDVPLLCIKAKKVLRDRFGAKFAQKYLGDVQPLIRLASGLAFFSNIGINNDQVRRLMETTVGVDKRRDLPGFNRAKIKTKKREELNTDQEKILYHPGCYALNNEPAEAEGTVKVLRALGIEPMIHDLDSCYVSSMSQGTYGSYASRIENNLRFIRSYVDKGYKLLTSSASCGLAYKVEYPSILKWADANAVAEHTLDIHEYLQMLQENGRLKLNFRDMPFKAAFHTPCHLRAQRGNFDPVHILNLIPGLHVDKLPFVCCGIAGTFGMKKKNFALSMKIGKRLFDEINDRDIDMVITSCGTCKMQIEQGTDCKVYHSMAFLADSLGF